MRIYQDNKPAVAETGATMTLWFSIRQIEIGSSQTIAIQIVALSYSRLI